MSNEKRPTIERPEHDEIEDLTRGGQRGAPRSKLVERKDREAELKEPLGDVEESPLHDELSKKRSARD